MSISLIGMENKFLNLLLEGLNCLGSIGIDWLSLKLLLISNSGKIFSEVDGLLLVKFL